MVGSLSALVVLRNAQSTVEPLTQHLLEILSDISPGFEILLIDEASTDATFEVAEQLQHIYPQVKAIRRPQSGFVAALQSGLLASTGSSLLVLHNVAAISATMIARLWQAVQQHPEAIVAGKVPRESSRGLQSCTRTPSAVQMVSRRVLQQVFDQLTDTEQQDQPWKLLLARHGYRWHVVPLDGRYDSPHSSHIRPAVTVPPFAMEEKADGLPDLTPAGS